MEDGVTKQDQQGKLNENTKLKKIRLRVKNIDRMNMRFFFFFLGDEGASESYVYAFFV